MELSGKVALVTGGAEGIGRAVSERLLQEQLKGVAILDINGEKGKETERELKEKHGQERIIFVKCDVSSKQDLEDAFLKTKTHFGRLDIVCNNAAVQDELDWEPTVDVNMKGVIRGTYLAVQHMGTKNGGNGGVVINTASLTAFLSVPMLSVYGATKCGIVGFTRNIANDTLMTENDVTVAAYCPGKVDTPIQHKCRTRNPEEFQKLNAAYEFVPMSHVTDSFVELIKNSGNMNGAVVAVLPGEPMKVIEPHDYGF
ncbi:15-hydroxyprostaglandin dehydrogenase [NAD(+)]-like [Glandiceps talaboti]